MMRRNPNHFTSALTVPSTTTDDTDDDDTTTVSETTVTTTDATSTAQPSETTESTSYWTETSLTSDIPSFFTAASSSVAATSNLYSALNAPSGISSDLAVESFHDPLPTPPKAFEFTSESLAATAQTVNNVGTSSDAKHPLNEVPVISNADNACPYKRGLRVLASSFATETSLEKSYPPLTTVSTDAGSCPAPITDEIKTAGQGPCTPDILIDALSGVDSLPCNDCDKEGEFIGTALTAAFVHMLSEIVDSVVAMKEDCLDFNANTSEAASRLSDCQ